MPRNINIVNEYDTVWNNTTHKGLLTTVFVKLIAIPMGYDG